jgi:hypothetical protein
MSKLIPKEILQTIPPLYVTEDTKDPVAHVKLFTPDSNWSWYITEYSQDDKQCFGLVDGHEQELGYFSLNELEELSGPMGLAVERDIHFQPTKLSEIRK